MPKAEFLTDRSAEELDDKCGMAFWWNRKHGKRGIVHKIESSAREVGKITHEDLAAVALMKDEDLTPEKMESYVKGITIDLKEEDHIFIEEMEVLYRRLGWLVAFALFIEPITRKNWRNIQVEDEIVLDRDPFFCAVTPDRVLENVHDGKIIYREYKTTISASVKWQQHWPYDIQPHVGMAAIEEELKKPVSYAQIMGLNKGFKSFDGGRLSHPYVWAYEHSKTGEWTHSYEKARSSEWNRMPVWKFPGSIVEWVLKCGQQVAIEQFPSSAPIALNRRMLENWVLRRKYRHQTIAAVEQTCRRSEETRMIYFEPRTQHCKPAFGDPCPFLQACWNAEIEKDPIRSGLYEERIPHHELELTWLKNTE